MKRVRPPRLALASTIALATIGGSCASPPAPVVPRPVPPSGSRPVDGGSVVDQVVEAHNLRRGKRALPPLKPSPVLEASAVEHARDMAERRKMSHRGGDGSSPFDRMKQHGYDFVAAAENVAYGFDDVESVMNGWMKSPGHKRNILGNFSEIGVGRAIGRDGASYWCVTFGTPAGR